MNKKILSTLFISTKLFIACSFVNKINEKINFLKERIIAKIRSEEWSGVLRKETNTNADEYLFTSKVYKKIDLDTARQFYNIADQKLKIEANEGVHLDLLLFSRCLGCC